MNATRRKHSFATTSFVLLGLLISAPTIGIFTIALSSGEDIFIIDPWENAYVYEYPRSDGHDGYLLFSKGPDGSASSFTSELTSTPEKKDIDNDNIPADEPGKW